MFASLTAVWYGVGNYLLADLSKDLGLKALYPQCISCILLWLCYHLFLIAHFKFTSNGPYFTKANSNYYLDGKLKLSAVTVPF